MKRLLSCLLLGLLVSVTGCAGSKNVTDNAFTFDAPAQKAMIAPEQFIFVGTFDQVGEDSTVASKERNFAFIKEDDGFIEKGLFFRTKSSSAEFSAAPFAHIAEFVSKGTTEVNGKECPSVVFASRPFNGYYIAEQLQLNGFILPSPVLVKVVYVQNETHVRSSVVYAEDVSQLEYTVKGWNDGSLTEKQKAYLQGFEERFAGLVDLEEVSF